MKTGEKLVRGHTFFSSEEWLDIARDIARENLPGGGPRKGAAIVDGERLAQAIDEQMRIIQLKELSITMSAVARESLTRDQVLAFLADRIEALGGKPVAHNPAQPLTVRPPK